VLHAEAAAPSPAALATPADLAELTPGVWSRSVARGPHGALTVAGVDLRDLAREVGTPAYVMDEDDFRARARAWREAFAGADVYYAGKAFLCTAVARWVQQEGLSLDVCTGGELETALRAGFPAERIGVHGNNKSPTELAAALDAGVGRIIVDSLVEIDRLAELAAARGVRAGVLVRITVGVEAHTHEFIATAHEDQKFGFSVATGAAMDAVRRVLAAPSLHLLGVHSHIGSQIFDTAGFEVSAHRAVTLLAAIRDEHGIELPELDLGGGLGVAYTAADDPVPVAVVAAQLRDIVQRECRAAGLAVPRLSVEPGRAIVGPTTFTVYEVGTVKPVEVAAGLVRTYVSVDGGMSDNIRPALYAADYSARIASRTSSADPALVRIAGKHCESGDIVVHAEYLPGDVAPGDLLAVPATGAYCWSMASNYNYLGRPAVVAVQGGAARVLVRGETEADLLSRDAGIQNLTDTARPKNGNE
jgi:diaminopimelate decarboxylase